MMRPGYSLDVPQHTRLSINFNSGYRAGTGVFKGVSSILSRLRRLRGDKGSIKMHPGVSAQFTTRIVDVAEWVRRDRLSGGRTQRGERLAREGEAGCVTGKYARVHAQFIEQIGEVAEWSKAAVLKTVDRRRSGGSNPSLSAIKSIT